jgi:acyl dehydratase
VSTLHWEDFTPGMTGVHGPRLVTREEIIAFATEFDPQPFHLDEEAARQSMLGGLAASGWHTCAIGMRLIFEAIMAHAASLGAPGVDEVRWLKPVRPGDQLTLHWTVLKTRPLRSRPAWGLVQFRFELFNQRGERVMTQVNVNFFNRRDPDAR